MLLLFFEFILVTLKWKKQTNKQKKQQKKYINKLIALVYLILWGRGLK